MATKGGRSGPTDKELAARAAGYAAHGGLVVLRGGYWDGNVSWADEYEALPVRSVLARDGTELSKRLPYERTDDFEDHPESGYGPMRVWRHVDRD